MERQGISVIYNRIDSSWHAEARTLVIAFLVVLFSSSCVSAACLWRNDYTYFKIAYYDRYGGGCNAGSEISSCSGVESNQCSSLVGTLTGFGYVGEVSEREFCGYGQFSECGNSWAYLLRIYCNIHYCSTQREADSLSCVTRGYDWVSDGDGSCNEPLDESVCDYYRQGCTDLGGRFSGHAIKVDGETCCSGECNLCGKSNMQRIKDLKTQECCNQLLAPPPDIKMCYTPVQDAATCGITLSRFADGTNGEWACQDPSLDSLVQQRYYEQCASPGSSSSAGSSGSEGASSEGGSAGGSSVSPYPEGCDECPWLDSILDTLTLQKEKVDQIYLCLTIPQLCSKDGTEESAIDTSLLPYLRPFMDSSLGLDSSQLKVLRHLDTNILKMLANDTSMMRLDSAKLHSDSLTRQAMMGGFGLLDSTTDAMNDTTRKWLRRIADSIHVSTDSLIKHLDSIRKTVPDSILDSIFKYQKIGAEREDSIVISSLPGLDSLLDSSLTYWRSFSDSSRAIHEAIEDISVRIGYQMGYGDTASTNLRGDIEGLKGGVDAFRDSAVYYFGEILKSSVSIGDSLHMMIGGGISVSGWDSAGIAHRWTDSVMKYMYTDAQYHAHYDSIYASWGADTLESAWDSSYGYGECDGLDCPPCTDDSCMGRVKSNLVEYGDSVASELGARLEESVRNQRDSLPSFLDSTFQELKQYSWFGSFDSTFLTNIGAKIPNTNTCPEHCFRLDVNDSYTNVPYNLRLDWKLCRPIAPQQLSNLNVFDIIKLLARILTVVTCISIIMWDVSSSRGKIGL